MVPFSPPVQAAVRCRWPAPARSALALLLPVGALLLQRMLWPKVAPFQYFFFYPAMFIGTWIGGGLAGALSVLLSVALVWCGFAPPGQPFPPRDAHTLATAALFIGIGLLSCLVHWRLRVARRDLRGALRLAWRANQQLQQAHADVLRHDEAARRNDAQFRALVEHTPDMILRFDRDGRCAYVNPAVAAVTGLAGPQLIGKTMGQSAVPAGFAAHCEQSIRTVILTRQALVFEAALPSMASVRNVQARVVPEYAPDGKVASVLLVARDISAIKGAEAVLRESEQRIHGIAANIPGMVFQCQLRRRDAALFFTYVSEGCQMLGLTPGALQARRQRILEFIAPADRAGFLDSLHASARTMTLWNWVGATIPIDGAARWVDCRASPRDAPDGVMWEGVMMDITDSKRREQELDQSRQLLRALSAHADGVREEERKRIARELHDELGQVLTALRMEVALLRLHHGAGNAALQAQVAAITATVDGTIRIVRDVTAALRPAALDLGLAAAIEWLLAECTRRAGVACTFANRAGDALVLDDARATAVFRLVQESLTNVAKHAHARTVRVELALRDDARLWLSIADDGDGFCPDGPRKPGTFGLVGMRERILMLGGTLRIDSAAGAGCRIEVGVPLDAGAAAAAA